MVVSNVTDLPVMSLSLICAGFESWACSENLLLCPTVCSGTSSFFVETRVSSSGKTWQAKLIEIVLISVAQG